MAAPKRRMGPGARALVIAVGAYVVLFALIALAIAPQQYDLDAGEVSPITITATKDVEDTITTERLRDAAAKGVDPSYISDSNVTPEVIAVLKEAFEHLLSINDLNKDPAGESLVVNDAMLWQAAVAVSPVSIDESVLLEVMDADDSVLTSLMSTTLRLVLETLTSRLAQGQEAEAVAKITRELQNYGFDAPLVSAATAIIREYIRPNMLLDEETTEMNRQKARDEVNPVVYKSGQNIVRAGEVVTDTQIALLNSLGMLKDRGVDLSLYFGVGLMLLLMIVMIAVYVFAFAREYLFDPRRVALLSVISVLVVALSLLLREISVFLMPVSLGVMLITLLIKPRLAIVCGIAYSVLTAMIVSFSSGATSTSMFTVVLTSIFTSVICVAMVRRRQQRSHIMLTGVVVAASNMVATIAAGFTNSANIHNTLVASCWAAGGGLLSAVLCIGFQPALEWAFNIDTSAKLLELSNPNQPLLRRLMLEAPGTYHHSIVVANLAEAAASAIGANGLLARVGAYYHDIGKLKRPSYFKENQMNDNPHDRTDPRVSTAILTAHPTDGVQMAQKARLPIAIQEIIQQHHGDTPVLYFFDKARKMGLEPDIADFRYPGPRPKTREGGVVMLADTTEAAVRAMGETSPEKIRHAIEKLTRSKLEDGQLDDCPLTFKDLRRVQDAFMSVLAGVFHERIEYPDIQIPARKTPQIELKPQTNEAEVLEGEAHDP